MAELYSLLCHPSDEGTLALGDEKAALIDTGMAFCAPEKIEKLRALLGGRPLDYIIVGHSHYDHIGAIPHIKKVWPDARIICGEHAAAVFSRPSALARIRALSQEAARTYRPEAEAAAGDYDDGAFSPDRIVREGDALPLGGLTLRVLETPGHTRDALSFYLPEHCMLKADETLGVLLSPTAMYPVYLVSCRLALESIDKCAALHPARVWSPHYGEVAPAVAESYFSLARRTVLECRELILQAHADGCDEAGILGRFAAKYRTPDLVDKQPEQAFLLNTAATIRCTLAEYAAGHQGSTSPGRAI
ncbi:MAG: MBL fold metallo-hydrolase [Oscillospiraceae bacterium]|nr:MBL fold metallo-hydrolase [Oscillospiraceae bacterium]